MSLSRVPSCLSQRPDFPKGLRVMVVDPDEESLQTTTAQLMECNYTVSGCASEEAATVALEKSDGGFDVLLCQTSVVAKQSSALTAFLQKTRDLPLVLMGKNCSQQQKMTGVKLGAVDFLEKPLSELKLRNLWQHTVRKMLRAQKQPSRANKTVKEEVVEIDQPAPAKAPSAPALGVTTRLHRAKQQESTGSSDAIEGSGGDASKDCAAVDPAQSVAGGGGGGRKGEGRRKAAPAAPSASAAPPQPQPQPCVAPMPAQQPSYMPGMPAPLPGCVWGLPMLPPPIPGLMGAPSPWAAAPGGMPVALQLQTHAAHGKPGVAVATAGRAPSAHPQPVYAIQPCWQPAAPSSAPQAAARCASPSPPSALAATPAVKAEAGVTHTSTTGSNSNSEATWQALDWGMDDMFLDDPEIDHKLDLNKILHGGLEELDHVAETAEVKGGEREADKDVFGCSVEAGETWLDDHSMLEDEFDTSLAGLHYFDGAEYNDELGLGLNKSPSLIDMIDHLCANEAA